MAKTKYIYQIDDPAAFKLDKAILGGKGYNLMRMKRMNLPVPIAFVVTTEACRSYLKDGKKFFKTLEKEIIENIKQLEKKVGREFGTNDDPLLVSVRSGAPVSMPGMMDTVLNLGLNAQNTETLKNLTNDGRFAYDCYRRFINMFGDVALDVHSHGDITFDSIVNKARMKANVKTDSELSEEVWRGVCNEFENLIKTESGRYVPKDPVKQIFLSIEAVFKSWNNMRAKKYRKMHDIDDSMGTAVIVQQMVFGNRDDFSASGVAFTRDPGNGEKKVFGEFLVKAQGEDVVAGIRTPMETTEMLELYKKDSKEYKANPEKSEKCNKIFKKNHKTLHDICLKLEKEYKDMQDTEFTIESGKFYILQTRRGQRTAKAAVKIAMDMYREKRIGRKEAVLMIEPASLDQLLHPSINPKQKYSERIFATGMPASPGAAVGTIVFNSDRAEEMVKKDSGLQVILVSETTQPDDIGGMQAAMGILTSRGGRTAHAAVVARGMGKPCICACSELRIDFKKRTMNVGNKTFKEGDWITIDGTRGEVIKGKLPLDMIEITGDFKKILQWSDDISKENNGLLVRANADTPNDSKIAVEMGARGIGLSRTEHMFMGERTELVAELILLMTKPTALDKEEAKRKKAILKELLKLQYNDFVGIFKAMDNLPVTIRLIDPPLHEFLPDEKQIKERIKKAHHQPGGREAIKNLQTMLTRRGEFHEENPMLGLRGCRLGVLYPEINRMQIEAIFKAAIKVQKAGIKVHPEIMIPLSSTVEELEIMHEMVDKIAEEVFKKLGARVKYLFGTMIEIPRAALVADDLAVEAEFFSFGTNDLTQMGYGISRDDAEEKFLRYYVDNKVMKENPFEKLDQKGIGRLMEISIEKGTSTRPELKLGICGEHGGEPTSIGFCHKIGLAYVSCNPYRVPIARVAAAHAALDFKRKPVKIAKKKSAGKVKASTSKKVKSKMRKVSPKKKSKK